jgi:tetratricopeptide (TPR) repeat protein
VITVRGEPGGKRESAALQDYLLQLTRRAASERTVEPWLRVARWHLWSRSPRMAQETAQKALAIDPRSIEAHEFIIKVTATGSESPVALSHLSTLLEINPAGKLDYQRRAAQIHLQNGRIDDAVRLFREVAHAQPGQIEALNDLAQAQQRAEAWEEALATLQQVFALTPPARREAVHWLTAARLRSTGCAASRGRSPARSDRRARG